MRVENPQARGFYEIECARQQWSVRQLCLPDKALLDEKLKEWISEYKEDSI